MGNMLKGLTEMLSQNGNIIDALTNEQAISSFSHNLDGQEGELLDLNNRPKYSDFFKQYPYSESDDAVYRLVGGNLESSYLEFKNRPNNPYANTCSLRISRALNYNGLIVAKSGKYYTEKGEDNRNYIVRLKDINIFLRGLFGTPDITRKGTDRDKIQAFKGQQGIITFEINGWTDASGHATMWDGNQVIYGHHINEPNFYFSPESYNSKLSNKSLST
jgi:hypothetical protein